MKKIAHLAFPHVTLQRLHCPRVDVFLSNTHAQTFVLLWTAVGENGSTHARTAGKTFNDFVMLAIL